jgi:hypothetical protein
MSKDFNQAEFKGKDGVTYVFRKPTMQEWDSAEAHGAAGNTGVANRELAQCACVSPGVDAARAYFERYPVAANIISGKVQQLGGGDIEVTVDAAGERASLTTRAGKKLVFRNATLSEWETFQDTKEDEGVGSLRTLARSVLCDGAREDLEAHFEDAPANIGRMARALEAISGGNIEVTLKKG